MILKCILSTVLVNQNHTVQQVFSDSPLNVFYQRVLFKWIRILQINKCNLIHKQITGMYWFFLKESNSYNTTSVVWLFTKLYSLLTLCFWKTWFFGCVDCYMICIVWALMFQAKKELTAIAERIKSVLHQKICIDTYTSLFIFPKHSPKTLFSQNKQLLCWWWQFWHLVNIMKDMTDLSVAAIMFSLWDVVWYMKYNGCKTQELGAAGNNSWKLDFSSLWW